MHKSFCKYNNIAVQTYPPIINHTKALERFRDAHCIAFSRAGAHALNIVDDPTRHERDALCIQLFHRPESARSATAYYIIDAIAAPWEEILEGYADAEELRALMSRDREIARQTREMEIFYIVLLLQIEGGLITIPFYFNQDSLSRLRYRDGTGWKEDLKQVVNGDS